MSIKNKNLFISYIEENKDVAELIWDELEKKGARPWAFTKDGHTKRWRAEVARIIKDSKIMILVFSKLTDQEADRQIVKELSLASDNGLDVVPFMVDDIKSINNGEIAYEIAGINWVNKESPIQKQIETLINRLENHFKTEDDVNTKQTPVNIVKINHENTFFEKTKQNKHFYIWKKILGVALLIVTLFSGYIIFKNHSLINSVSVSENKNPNDLKYIIAGTKDVKGRWTGWINDMITIKYSDEFLYFNLHYYPNKLKFKNARIGMDKVPKELEAGSAIVLDYFFTADNVKPNHSYYQIQSLDDIELIPERISWQEEKCQSIKCESDLLQYSSENEKLNDLFTRGIDLGDIDANKYGNLVVKFRIKYKKNKVKDNLRLNSELTTNSDPNKIATLLTNNKLGTRLLPTINVRSGDNLGFNIHYYGWYQGINDLRVKTDNLNGKFFEEDERLTVDAVVTSKNLNSSYGQVDIIFDEAVKLKLRHISWQKNNCKSTKCEALMPEDSSNIFSEDGLSLGDIFAKDNSDYFGNIVVSYDVLKVDNNATIKK